MSIVKGATRQSLLAKSARLSRVGRFLFMRPMAYKSRFFISTAFIASSVLLSAGCVVFRREVLEIENVAQYQLTTNPETKVPVKISGLCFISSHCVSGIRTRTDDGVMVVLVEIGSCKEGRSGSFAHPLNIPANVAEVRFGRNERLLWKREGASR